MPFQHPATRVWKEKWVARGWFKHALNSRIQSWTRKIIAFHFVSRPLRFLGCCSTFFNYSNAAERRVFTLEHCVYYIVLYTTQRLIDLSIYTAINQVSVGCWFQKMGSVHGEELPFVFGAPLVDGFGHFPRNYTRSEVALSESIVQFFANFVRTG